MTPQEQAKAKGWIELFKDNSDPYDKSRGILAFATMVFPHFIESKYGIPHIHHEMYFETLQMFHPRNVIMHDRQVQFEEARDCAKSTIGSFILPLYLVCLNGSTIKIANTKPEFKNMSPAQYGDDLNNYLIDLNGVEVPIVENVIIIMSETLGVAEGWTLKIRYELTNNKFLKALFGRMKPGKLEDEEGKWSSSLFRVLRSQSGNYDWQKGRDVDIIAKGINQQTRGINTLGRPTTYIADDLYSLKTVLTAETRQKTRYKYTAEAKGGVDRNSGKIICIGTKVHEDTIIEDNEKNRRFRVVKHCIMDKDKFMYVVNNYVKVDSENRSCIIPDADICKELEESGYITVWPERISLHMLLSMYSEAFEGRNETKTLSIFWQEYFHEVLSEEDKKFKRYMLQDLDFELTQSVVNGSPVMTIVITNPDGSTTLRNVNTCIAVDGATSYKTGADDTAIVWVCKDFYDRVYVYKALAGKFGASDEFNNDADTDIFLSKLCMDRSRIKRIGSTDEIFRWVQPYPVSVGLKFVIETNHVGAELTRQVNKKRRIYNRSIMFEEVCNTKQSKEDRIYDALGPYAESKALFFKKGAVGMEQLKNQLEYLGKTSKDDLCDACATGVTRIMKPGYIKQEDLYKNINKVDKPVGSWKTLADKFGQKFNNKTKYNTIWRL